LTVGRARFWKFRRLDKKSHEADFNNNRYLDGKDSWSGMETISLAAAPYQKGAFQKVKRRHTMCQYCGNTGLCYVLVTYLVHFVLFNLKLGQVKNFPKKLKKD